MKKYVIRGLLVLLLLALVLWVGKTMQRDREAKKEAREPHAFYMPDLIELHLDDGKTYTFLPDTEAYQTVTAAVEKCWKESQDEKEGFVQTGIGFQEEEALAARRIVLSYEKPVEWKFWTVEEGAQAWNYDSITFFIDSVFGETNHYAVLSKGENYSEMMHQLVMEEETFREVISLTNLADEKYLEGRVLKRPSKILLYEGEKAHTMERGEEAYEEIYETVKKCWEASKEKEGRLVFVMLAYLNPEDEPEDRSRLVFCYDDPIGWGLYNETSEMPMNTYTFFLQGFRGHCLISADERYLEQAFIIEIQQYKKIQELCGKILEGVE